MQQPVSRRDVYEPSLTARIGGREVELESASMDRMLPDPLAGGSLTAASGDLVTVEGEDVTDRVVTPWDTGSQWPPVPQAPVSVSMDTGAGAVSVLGRGRVVSASGGTGGREVSVEVADAYQSLDRTISWDAVAAHMPATSEYEYGRYVGMFTTSITDTILRHCGWYSTPPRINYTMLSVPAQGTMWPERGWVDSCFNLDNTGYPSWLHSAWGRCVSDVDALYELQGGGYTLAGRGGLEMAAMTASAGAGRYVYMDARSRDWLARIRLSWTDNHGLVRFYVGGTWETAVTVPRSDGLLYATIRYISSTRLSVTLRSGGEVRTETVTVGSEVTTGELRVGHIIGDGRGAGFQIAAPNTLGTLVGWEPNAVLYPRSGGGNNLTVREPVEGASCVDLLASQCEAECATYWIDETGVLRWWDLARLETRQTVATLNSDDDITEGGFEWSHTLSSVKSRVSVKWREPAVDRSWSTSVDLWQGNGRTLHPGDVIEDWINVPEDEIWIMPDLSLGRVGDSYRDFNYGIGSWYGGIVDRGDGVDTWAQLHGSLLMTVERVTDKAFKTWVQWTGDREATQRTHGERPSSALWIRRRNFDLPIIRGKAKVAFTDQITYSAQSGEPTAPEHEIDAGWWIQDAAQAQYVADYAGARLTVPQPVLSSIDLIPVPGLQLGDMVTVTDTHVTDLTIRGLVVEDSRSIDSEMGMSHAVAVRPVAVSRNRVDWQDWGSVMAGQAWQTWGSRQQPDTWQQWASDPLEED